MAVTKKESGTVELELVRAKRYVYKDTLYLRGQEYTVDEETADHLLDQLDSYDVPFFRTTASRRDRVTSRRGRERTSQDPSTEESVAI